MRFSFEQDSPTEWLLKNASVESVTRNEIAKFKARQAAEAKATVAPVPTTSTAPTPEQIQAKKNADEVAKYKSVPRNYDGTVTNRFDRSIGNYGPLNYSELGLGEMAAPSGGPGLRRSAKVSRPDLTASSRDPGPKGIASNDYYGLSSPADARLSRSTYETKAKAQPGSFATADDLEGERLKSLQQGYLKRLNAENTYRKDIGGGGGVFDQGSKLSYDPAGNVYIKGGSSTGAPVRIMSKEQHGSWLKKNKMGGSTPEQVQEALQQDGTFANTLRDRIGSGGQTFNQKMNARIDAKNEVDRQNKTRKLNNQSPIPYAAYGAEAEQAKRKTRANELGLAAQQRNKGMAGDQYYAADKTGKKDIASVIAASQRARGIGADSKKAIDWDSGTTPQPSRISDVKRESTNIGPSWAGITKDKPLTNKNQLLAMSAKDDGGNIRPTGSALATQEFDDKQKQPVANKSVTQVASLKPGTKVGPDWAGIKTPKPVAKTEVASVTKPTQEKFKAKVDKFKPKEFGAV